ncbi:LuxR C-terminal-related transcriptional regulator [Nocardiopsis algeriensis]|uniref:LuxR C-terminal-related transcriptional regulator n=1 Tax=Nocardiopsis algeriensis TaxID=1478215 RepID=UPI003B42F74B
MASLTAPARHNLPRPGTGFVGREQDLSSLLRLLESSRSVTLCGTEGIGKSRLALRVAEHSTVSFPDGVWYADLSEARTSLEVFVRIARAVGVVEEPGQPLEATVIEALRDRRLLLVLDSCAYSAPEVAGVGNAILSACPAASVLITSVEPLRLSGGTVWRMTPLALPVAARNAPPPDPGDSEAVRLLLERARARDPRFSVPQGELETAAVLCDLAGGVPLGIELLGASAPETGMEELAEGLRGHLASPRFRPGPGQALPRSEVLPVVLDFVHGLLGEAEQVLLRRLSVFWDWDLELAEQVCTDGALPESKVLDLLTSLLDRSLITVAGEFEGRVRYRFPGAVRRFAAERLADAGEVETFRQRLLDRMLDLVEDLGRKLESGRAMPWSERDAGRQRVTTEYDTLRSLLRWTHEHGRAEPGLRLCTSLVGYWVSCHSCSEGAYLMDLLMGLEDAERSPSWARALVGRAQLARMLRDHGTALEAGEEGLRLCRESDDEKSVRAALNLLALVEVRERVPDQAAVRVEEALRLSRESGDVWGEAIALGTRGALAAQQGDHTTADHHYDAALSLLRGIDHRWGVGVTLLGQARAAETGGDLVTADRCYREALDTQRLIAVASDEACCLAGIGRVAHAQGRTAQALDHLSEGMLMSHESGQRAEAARALVSIARLVFDSGAAASACRLAGAAARVREQLGLPVPAAPWPFSGSGTRRRRNMARWWKEGRALSLAEAVREAEKAAEECRRRPARRAQGGSGRRPRPAAGPALSPETTSPQDGLTRRELEVARLVSGGKSNPEIARALFITPSTAARHIANINRKMGFNSRTQIAAWVERHRTS